MTSVAKDFAELDWGLDGHEFASLADAPNDLMQLSVTGKGERLRAVLPPAINGSTIRLVRNRTEPRSAAANAILREGGWLAASNCPMYLAGLLPIRRGQRGGACKATDTAGEQWHPQLRGRPRG